MTNTYSRTLLAGVGTPSVREALDDARQLLSSLNGSSISSEVIEALDHRLELRQVFLEVAETPQHRNEPEKARQPWTDGLPLLAKLGKTHALAQPVDESFSVKLQRKLASTMPPRPIVQLSFDDALGHFTRLFRDGEQMIDVLHFHDTQSLQVCSGFLSLHQISQADCLDICLYLPSEEATALGLRSNAAANLPLQRNGVPWHYEHPPDPGRRLLYHHPPSK